MGGGGGVQMNPSLYLGWEELICITHSSLPPENGDGGRDSFALSTVFYSTFLGGSVCVCVCVCREGGSFSHLHCHCPQCVSLYFEGRKGRDLFTSSTVCHTL